MKLVSGEPARYAGPWWVTMEYMSGALVSFSDGHVYCSRIDHNRSEPLTTRDWVDMGSMGPSPTTVVHSWSMVELQYPVGNEGEMSEPALVCGDCWKDGDFRNAFHPEKHLYVIKEFGCP